MAAEFNELSLKQLLAIIPLINKGGDKDMLKLKCLKVLLNASTFKYYLIPAETKLALLPVIDWLFEDNTLTEQKLPEYRGLYGPKKEFDNLTLKEFHYAELHYDEYLKADSGSERALNHLVAVLYRRPKMFYNRKLDISGDIRKPFNEHLLDYYADQVATWPEAVKLLILAWYDGCRQFVRDLYDTVFSGGKDSQGAGEPGMFDCIREIARDGKYGPFDRVELLNIHTALFEMEHSIQEAEELKQLYKA